MKRTFTPRRRIPALGAPTKGAARRRATVIAGSAVAALATAGVLAVSGAAEAPTGQTISLIEKPGIEKFIDAPPRATRARPSSPGDQFMYSYPLVTGANARAGRIDARCTFTKGGRKASGICDGVISLADGDLLLAVRLKTEGDVNGAIVGGTGAYAGARGTFTSVETKGGAHDTITLLP
jgi:hypothetical protein